MEITELVSTDRQHVWHPYASTTDPLPVLPVVAAKGTRLTLADGRELVDGMSSWWAAVHGYGHPVLDAALHAQVDRLGHVMFGGLTHEPAVELVRRLVDLTPAGLEHVFLADSGSVSVEVAMKMALQWHLASGDRRTQPARGTAPWQQRRTTWPSSRSSGSGAVASTPSTG